MLSMSFSRVLLINIWLESALSFVISYNKSVKLLTKFINDQGKITPRRVTGTSSKMHRKLVLAIKRARNIALLPFAAVDRD